MSVSSQRGRRCERTVGVESPYLSGRFPKTKETEVREVEVGCGDGEGLIKRFYDKSRTVEDRLFGRHRGRTDTFKSTTRT